MSDHIKAEAKKHRVKFVGGTKYLMFDVFSGSEPIVHEVRLQLSCECLFMTRYGIAHGEPCSGIVAALAEIVEKGGIPR